MTTLGKICIAILGAMLALSGFFAAHLLSPQQKSFGDVGTSIITSVSKNTSVQVGPGVTTQVLATSTARIYAYLSTAATSTSQIYCNLSDSPAVIGNGLVLGTTTPFTIDSLNLYIGAIECIAPASTTLSIVAQQ